MAKRGRKPYKFAGKPKIGKRLICKNKKSRVQTRDFK